MKLLYLLVFICFLTCICTYAQKTNRQIDQMIEEDFKKNNESEEFYKNVENIFNTSKKQNYAKGMILSGRLLMLHAMNSGKNVDVIKIGNEIKTLQSGSIEDMNSYYSDIYRMSGVANASLGFKDIGYNEIRRAIEYGQKIKSEDLKHYKLSIAYKNITIIFEEEPGKENTFFYYLQKSLAEAEMISDKTKDFPINYKYDMIAGNYNLLGVYYKDMAKPKNLKMAETYFKTCVEISNKYEELLSNKFFALVCLGDFYHETSKYEEAVEVLEQSLVLEKKVKDPEKRMSALNTLAKSYLALGQNKKSTILFDEYSVLTDSIKKADKKSVTNLLGAISSEKEKKHNDSINRILIVTISIFLIFALIIFVAWKMYNKNIHSKYDNLIKKIEMENKHHLDFSLERNISTENDRQENAEISVEEINIEEEKANIKIENKANGIADQTLNSILNKLEKFEKSKIFIKNEVSFTYLATFTGTNTKYLSEILKQHRGKSYTNYINGLRIKYIINLIYENPKYRDYKISYLAEACGFSSREVFTVVFKKETGITPSYYIENLKNSTEEC